MDIHTIRLQGPWDAAGPLDMGSPDEWSSTEDFRRVFIPATWRELFGETAGTVHFQRGFHEPSSLKLADRVFLEFPHQCGELLRVAVNELPLSPESDLPLRFEVSDVLDDFNILDVWIRFDPRRHAGLPGGLWRPVLLLIAAAGDSRA